MGCTHVYKRSDLKPEQEMIVCPVADIGVAGKARSAGGPSGLSVGEVLGGKLPAR
jgi:hypothetical protein